MSKGTLRRAFEESATKSGIGPESMSGRAMWKGWLGCIAFLEPVVKDAERWRTFERALRTGHLQGAAHGRRFKIIETCAMSGDEKEFNAFVEAIDAALDRQKEKQQC